jgi:hypothetical protein
MITQEIITEKNFLNEQESYEFCLETEKLANNLKSGFMLLGKRLFEINQKKLYQPIHDAMYQYCESIGVDSGTASKLMTIYEQFCYKYKLPFEDIIDLEYTKLYLVRKLITDRETAENWIDEIKSGLTISDLKKIIKEKELGVEQMKCSHKNTYKVECCRDCGEKWEIYE